jgi:hypothetical protein
MGPYVHETLTARWAAEEGLAAIADAVGAANADFDRRFPGRLPMFWVLHLGPLAAVIGRVRLEIAVRSRSPRVLGWALHGIQDYFSHGWLGEKHLLLRMGLLARHPDIWEDAPAGVRRRIERTTRRWLRRYAEAVGERTAPGRTMARDSFEQ